MRSLILLLGASIAVSSPAIAREFRAYDAASFQALQNKNAATVVFVHAPWCPVCRAQEQVIKKLVATPELVDTEGVPEGLPHCPDIALFGAEREALNWLSLS